MERYVVWHMEQGRELLKPGIEQSLVIYDMEGFGLSNMVNNILRLALYFFV